jgi:hypothetical protein
MKNIKLSIAIILFAAVGLSSCIDHEVIPAPIPMVELDCHFQGTINGTNVEFTENVLGYYCNAEKAKILLPPPNYSSAVYYSEILSAQTPVSIKVGLGSVMWDASTTSDPTLTLFNNFHINNTLPVFSNSGTTGFEVTYRDGLGKTWVSDENSVNYQDVIFSNIVQESDSSGDYSKFVCDFDCYVYRINDVTLLLDSLRIQAAEFEGWFKR